MLNSYSYSYSSKRITFLDQAVSSASNYLPIFFAVLFLGNRDVGLVSFALSIYTFLLSLIRIPIGNSFMHIPKSSPIPVLPWIYVLLLGCATVLIAFLEKSYLEAHFGLSFYLLGGSFFAGLLEETVRLLRISQKRFASALLLDSIWLLTTIFWVAVSASRGNVSARDLIMAFAAGALLSGAISILYVINVTFESIAVTKIKGVRRLFHGIIFSTVVAFTQLFVTVLYSEGLLLEYRGIYQRAAVWFLPLGFYLNAIYLQLLSTPFATIKSDNSRSSASFNLSKRISLALTLLSFAYAIYRGISLPFYVITGVVGLTSYVAFQSQLIGYKLLLQGHDREFSFGKFIWSITTCALSLISILFRDVLILPIMLLICEIIGYIGYRQILIYTDRKKVNYD